MSRPASPNPPGALVISLDFERRWGVRERTAHGSYLKNLRGEREAIEGMLALFREFEIAATWATVGFLFAESREDIQRFGPATRPRYANPVLSPYGDPIGEGESDDPLNYAPTVIAAIRETPRQEIATHTYSHYYCNEPGQDADAFDADLSAAQAIASAHGITFQSIVFPRNQHNPRYDPILRAHGITTYRGSPPSWRVWGRRFGPMGTRLARFADTYVGLARDSTIPWLSVLQLGGLCDVRASCFLRPYQPRLRHLEGMRLRRISRALYSAAARGELLHLWWHPHNFGIHTAENLAFLRRVLGLFAEYRARFGMQSLSMAEAAAFARALPRRQLHSRRLLHVTTVPMSLWFLRGQAAYMRSRGIEIHAVSSPGEDLEAYGRTEAVPVQAIDMPRRITPLHDLLAITRLCRVLWRIRPHIVHAHTPKGGLLGMIAATLTRTPVRIYHIRGLPLEGARGPLRWVLRATELLSCRLAHRVLCVSHSIRGIAIEEGLCPPEKLGVLLKGTGNGVDAEERFNPLRFGGQARHDSRDRLGIPDESLVIGFVGRLVRDKGIVELTDAWRMIRTEYPTARLVLVGPLESRDALAPSVVQALRDDPRVHLLGMERSIVPLYAAMDLVVLPTYREGFPNVPMEAAAMGLPVVATRISGCIDAVEDEVTGTLVPVRDVPALAAAMRRYLYDPSLRQQHGAAGRARVLRDFRPEAIWEALHLEYLQLLDARAVESAPPDAIAVPLR